MRRELRCPATLHGVLVDGNRLEVKCGRRHCGAERGVVVLHVIDLDSGQVVETRKFRDPMKGRKS